jgi:hypothetical protein
VNYEAEHRLTELRVHNAGKELRSVGEDFECMHNPSRRECM